VLIGVIAWLAWPRGTTEVTKKEALNRFRRSDRSTTSVAASAEAEATSRVPAAGVYTYDATGTENAKIGPFPAQNRTLPETVTAAAVDASGGCFDFTLNLFAEHTEDTRWCRDGESLRLERYVKHQKVGAITFTVTVKCDPAVFVKDLDSAGSAKVSCKLSVEGGPFSVSAELPGEATWGDSETMAIGGTDVEVRRLAIRYPVTGSVNGEWDETIWLDQRLLPVRIERSLHLAGPATFDEASKLTLRSLSPET